MFHGVCRRDDLFWLVPVVYGSVIVLGSFAGLFVHNPKLIWFAVPVAVVAPIGGWWGVYQCIRYEKHPRNYLLVILLIPLGFLWYYQKRYLPRAA